MKEKELRSLRLARNSARARVALAGMRGLRCPGSLPEVVLFPGPDGCSLVAMEPSDKQHGWDEWVNTQTGERFVVTATPGSHYMVDGVRHPVPQSVRDHLAEQRATERAEHVRDRTD